MKTSFFVCLLLSQRNAIFIVISEHFTLSTWCRFSGKCVYVRDLFIIIKIITHSVCLWWYPLSCVVRHKMECQQPSEVFAKKHWILVWFILVCTSGGTREFHADGLLLTMCKFCINIQFKHFVLSNTFLLLDCTFLWSLFEHILDDNLNFFKS